MRALIFDCDGVLADTERWGHWPAFNQMFKEFGVPIQWSEDEYARKLKIGGGKERISSELTRDFVWTASLPTDADERALIVSTWHKRKTEIFQQMVATGSIPPRPGVARIIGEAREAGWKLGIASTSAEPSVAAILTVVLGPSWRSFIDVILAGDCVARKKPAPDIYRAALEQLHVGHKDALAVEDSKSGLEAASGAELRCIITVNEYTKDEDFSEAVMVVSSLGEPEGEKTEVLSNRSQASPGDYVTLSDLESCLDGPLV